MPLDFQPKYDKIVELLLYLAHKRPGADKYQVVKLFYLADSEHLNRHGRPITHERYYALRYGPVASIAMDFLEGDPSVFKAAGVRSLPFRTEVLKDDRGKDITYIREPRREVNYSLFSKSDLKVFDEIIAKHGDKNFDQLYELTHDHYAYKKAWGSRGILSKRAAMAYEDMVDDPAKRESIVEDIGPVAARMK